MSGPTPFPRMTCRKCPAVNPTVYFAPVMTPDNEDGSCICFNCASGRRWLDQDGNLKPEVSL